MMPPELLVSGKLTPAADVYSFGIMSKLAGLLIDTPTHFICHADRNKIIIKRC
jgi:hypothetical protein